MKTKRTTPSARPVVAAPAPSVAAQPVVFAPVSIPHWEEALDLSRESGGRIAIDALVDRIKTLDTLGFDLQLRVETRAEYSTFGGKAGDKTVVKFVAKRRAVSA